MTIPMTFHRGFGDLLGVPSGGIFFMKWEGGALYKLSIGDGAFKSHVMSYKSYVKLTSYERTSN